MVCQAAGQTRFRALKHENGIAGSAAIIIRVIACFQPLQDCQYLDRQSPNLNSLGALVDSGRQNTTPAYMKPYSNEVSPKGSFPSYADIGLPQSRVSQTDDVRRWVYCLPPQAFAPAVDLIPRKEPFENTGGHGSPGVGSGYAQKRFLVFDQSGDQTTLLYSGVGTPLLCLNPWNGKPPSAYNWLKEEPGINRETISHFGPCLGSFLNDGYDQMNQKDEVESEMHEDTEELNALLYSDDYYNYSEDDEETSTGHSPSTMTSHDLQDRIEEKGEEVASSVDSAKRQKLLDGGYGTASLLDATVLDATSSLKCLERSELEDDAESGCGDGHDQVPGEFSPLSGRKRSRKGNVRETLRILQSIIPDADGKGKDTVDIIDEAIHHLRSLKAKVKELGLDTMRF